jgi:threonine dehydrogenase-like Zn-dependent dehydrogenase
MPTRAAREKDHEGAPKPGDRIVVPFTIICGGYAGGQAEYVHVPFQRRIDGCSKVVLKP